MSDPSSPAVNRVLVPGIHHVTVIASDPVVNLYFYTQFLGLRLIKQTVNYDDPTTWHLYFGDRTGDPGSLVTFFPNPLAKRGRFGSGEVARIVMAIPQGSLEYWHQRLQEHEVDCRLVDGKLVDGESQPLLQFSDGDGTRLALVEVDRPQGIDPWTDGGVDAEFAILGIESVQLEVSDPAGTQHFFEELLGWVTKASSSEGATIESGSDSAAKSVGVIPSTAARARMGAASVHHVAFRVADQQRQLALRERLVGQGYRVTEVLDRQYFRSIYFREPGGVIFEIATDGPGFTIDETEAELGTSLKLPPWLEPRRSEIESHLTPLK